MSNFRKVGTFMKIFGQEVKTKPSLSTEKINKLRIDLIKEELEELTEAMNNNDLLEVADALTDILYVRYGAGHAFGINLDKSASVNCFSKINGADIVDDKFIVYLGTNLNIDLIIQSLFWLLLFSFIPKSKNSQSGEIKYKNISNLLIEMKT